MGPEEAVRLRAVLDRMVKEKEIAAAFFGRMAESLPEVQGWVFGNTDEDPHYAEECKALVRSLGCSLVQGYIFGRPMPADEAIELAMKGAATLPAQLPPREARIRIIRAALLHYQGQVKGARLRNISSGGALIECRDEMPVGAEIQLDFAAGGLIDAEIRWSKGTQFGVQFKEKFNLKLLQIAKPGVKPSAVMTPNYKIAGDSAD